MDFEDSIAELTAKEAMKIEIALKDLEDKLFVPVEIEQPPDAAEEVMTEHDVYRDYVQSSMAGYSAHTEEVTEEEILLWQRNFSYLHVRGEAMLELDPDYIEDEEDHEYFHPMPHEQPGVAQITYPTGQDDDSFGLRVSGRAIVIREPPHNPMQEEQGDAENEELLCCDGVWEETLHIDTRPAGSCSDHSDCDIFASVEPLHSQQAEVVHSLVDVIFPDIAVTSLRPLVEMVVRAGREHGVQYRHGAEEGADLQHCGVDRDCSRDECLFYSGAGDLGDKGGVDSAQGASLLVVPGGWDSDSS